MIDREYQIAKSGKNLTIIEILSDIGLLWRQKRKILGLSATGGIVAAVIAFMLPSIYESSILTQPVTEKSPNSLQSLINQYGGVASLMGINARPADSKTVQAIATLNSRKFITGFIKDHNLLPILFHDEWDAEKKKWISDGSGDVPTLMDGYELFTEDIFRVSQDEDNGLVTISVQWTERQLTAIWATQILTRLNTIFRLEDKETFGAHLEYLNEKMALTKISELKSSLSELIRMETQRLMLADSRTEYVFKTIDPAIAPEEKNNIKPRRALIIFLGLLLGGIFGFLWGYTGAFISPHLNQKPEQN